MYGLPVDELRSLKIIDERSLVNGKFNYIPACHPVVDCGPTLEVDERINLVYIPIDELDKSLENNEFEDSKVIMGWSSVLH